MANIGAQQKKGYYKTPSHLISKIAKYLVCEAPQSTRVLDPCAGTGEALYLLGRELEIPPANLYANELDEERAALCREHAGMNIACGCGVSELRTPHYAYPLIYVNAPYDWEGEGKGRTEEKFLTTLSYLCNNGILIMLVPHYILSRREFRDELPLLFKDIIICRFPEDDFKAFGQSVVFARKKYGKLKGEVENYEAELSGDRVLGDGSLHRNGKYSIPANPNGRGFYFHSENLDQHTFVQIANSAACQKDMTYGLLPPPMRTTKTLMPLRTGHTGWLLSTGLMDGIYRRSDGALWVVGGTVKQRVDKKTEVQEDRTVEYHYHRPAPVVSAFDMTASMKTGQLILRTLE